MNFSRIEPMPGEPAAAHQGRMAWLLGISGESEFKVMLRERLQSDPKTVGSRSRLGQLAAISGMRLADYARQHSMLGVFRVAVKAEDWAPFGSTDDVKGVRTRGMLIHKPGAHLCPQCVKEDLEHWHFSWFRRSHQVQGVDWCPSHKRRLVRVTASEPWARLPQHWVESGEIAENHSGGDKESDFESRFAENAMAMLERPAPFRAHDLGKILADRARTLGLRTSRNGRRKNLSDLLREIAPSEWLRTYWPDIAHKVSGAFVLGLDRLPTNLRTDYPGICYLTAMAALWDSPLELHQELQQTGSATPSEEAAVVVPPNRPVEFWHGTVWDAYVRHHGNVSQMSADLAIERTYLQRKIREIGLPGFRGLRGTPELRAFLRFEAGETVTKACEAEDADVEEVEELIRVSCARVATAARMLDADRSRKTANKNGAGADKEGKVASSQLLSPSSSIID